MNSKSYVRNLVAVFSESAVEVGYAGVIDGANV